MQDFMYIFTSSTLGIHSRSCLSTGQCIFPGDLIYMYRWKCLVKVSDIFLCGTKVVNTSFVRIQALHNDITSLQPVTQ